jgi:hypothetical protein
MPLSEYEQRVLEELERDLGSDPKLASSLARPHRSGGRILAAVLGVSAGLAIVLAGVMSQVPLLGLGGFVLMASSALWGFQPGGKRRGSSPQRATSGRGRPAPRRGFIARLEERFERRREQGDL